MLDKYVERCAEVTGDDGLMKPRTLRVGAVQMVSENGALDANLTRAARLVREAVDMGASLILLPELFHTANPVNRQVAHESIHR